MTASSESEEVASLRLQIARAKERLDPDRCGGPSHEARLGGAVNAGEVEGGAATIVGGHTVSPPGVSRPPISQTSRSLTFCAR